MHVRRLPCEDVPVLPEDVDERVFLFVAHIGPYVSDLGGLSRVKWPRLGLGLVRLKGNLGDLRSQR